MLKLLHAGGILALLLPTVAIASPISAPTIYVKSAISSNKQTGQRISVGDPITTGKSGIVTGDFRWGGVRSFSLLPSSSLELGIYGNRSNGARYTRFNIFGEAFVEVVTVNPATEVQVCFKNRWGRSGCGILKSSVRVAPLIGGEQVVAVTEGNVRVQDEDEAFSSVALASGQYSILKKDGQFTPAQSIFSTTGYRFGLHRSRTIAVFEAKPGWRFCDGEITFQAAIGARLCLKSPLVP